MIRVKYLIGVMVVLLVLPGMVWGMNNEVTGESLRGIKGVTVVIEKIEQNLETNGLTKTQIQTDVELKLRMAGLKVLSEKEREMEPGRPWFYVVVTSFQTSPKLHVYTIKTELCQDVSLLRNDKVGVAPTWSKGYVGINTKDIIRDKIKDLVDIFLNAWLSVNPK